MSTRAAFALALITLTLPHPARADGGRDDARSQAAAAYDRGVAHFNRGEFEEAAQAFLRADELVPSDDALGNAITAADRAGDHLLVVHAAERAVGRDPSSALAASARKAQADSARHLARVELGCQPGPCTITFDGEANAPGSHYVLPGTHKALATSGAARAEQSLDLEPGATYRVVLHPVTPGSTRHAAEITRSAPPARDRSAASKPLPPAVFYVGVGATVVLAGATTWSGLDTLSAKHALPDRPTTAQVDAVKSRILRTDILLGGSVIAAALTTWAGVSLVDWNGGTASAVLVPAPGGALGAAVGRF